MKKLLSVFIIAALYITACNNETAEAPEDIVSAVQHYNETDQYDDAFEVLGSSLAKEHEHYEQLRLATHLNYALYLTYEAEQVPMTQRMPDALRHFRRVLELDPQNERAEAEIALIESIYNQLGRDIPEGVAE